MNKEEAIKQLEWMIEINKSELSVLVAKRISKKPKIINGLCYCCTCGISLPYRVIDTDDDEREVCQNCLQLLDWREI